MAQMAPALTEATASPESSRKNSVDRHCTSTVEEDFKQENNGLGLDLKLVSHNGLVRLISDNNIADIANTIKPSEQNTPIVPKRIEEIKGKTEMPNGHYGVDAEKTEAAKSSYFAAKEEKRNASLDLSRTCASTAKSSAGNCNTGCVNEERNRVSHHPVASLNSSKLLMPLKTTQAVRRQGKLESRVKEVETRLRKLQARQLSDHVLHQLGSLVAKHSEYCNSPSSALRIEENSGIGGISESKTNANNSLELKRDQIHNTTMPGSFVSTVKGNLSSFGSVLKELEQVSSESSNMDERNVFDDFKLQLDAVNCVESWSSQLELLESIDDSDATEGSSGEESEDEGDARKSKLRSKRAKMLRKQYKMEEGEVASHWSWLQSQIINLERQIRRYDDLYKGGRIRKGPVRLQACAARANSQTSSAGGIFESGIAKDLKKSPSALPPKDDSENINNNSLKEADNHLWNGMKRTLLDKSLLGDEDQPLKRYRNALMKNDLTDGRCSGSLPASTNDLYFQCARTRGVYGVKKRRLVRLSQIRHGPRRAAVGCMCVTPVTPCLMCSKSPKALPVVSPKQTMAEKVALLDQSFHPVLSFCADIPLQLHFGALLKRGGFEKRTKPQALRNITQTNTVEKTKPPVVAKTGGRRSQLAKGAAASLLSSAKFHNQKHDRKRGYSVPSTPRNTVRGSDTRVCQTDGPRKKRAAAISAAAQLQKRARSLSLPTVISASSPTPTSTPSPTPGFSQSMPPSSLTTLMKKRKGSNAFDINNIVIPYSMASSTRVEKLQYKEIPTPSWRINDIGPEETASTEDDKSEKKKEDMSDDLYISRHAFCEEHERKRFLGLVKKKRKRATRQSSELSLPDPSSPVGYVDSQGGTPPGTPTCYAPSPLNVNNSQSVSVVSLSTTALAAQPLVVATNSTTAALTPSFSERLHRSLSDPTVVHRRSSSTDRSEKSVTEYEEVWPPVSPWPSRTFPLSDSDITSLKLPTPLPTPSSSMPGSPAASSPASPVCSPLASPASDASSEKNEWTVKLVSDQGPTAGDEAGGPPRKGIVLKLAKR